jgi:uncharacterized protein
MSDAAVAARPVWVELGSSDPAASREFYAKVFGWRIEVSPDPQFGGYALAKIGGEDVAGIGPNQAPEQPTAWGVYFGTADGDALAAQVAAAGGTVVMPPFPVGNMGRMAIFQDPAGAFVRAWQPLEMAGFGATGPGSFGWTELSARGLERAIPFYETVFGWSHRTSDMGDGTQYTEFLDGDDSIAGAMEMNPMAPAGMPSYWMAYFLAGDVDDRYRAALAAGAREMLGPTDFAGGRFAIVADPHGAVFGILKMAAA